MIDYLSTSVLRKLLLIPVDPVVIERTLQELQMNPNSR